LLTIAAAGVLLAAFSPPLPAARALEPSLQKPGAAGAPASPPALRTVVIDPAHGGADEGARGPSGVVEKDAVLSVAQVVAATLERQGFTVVLTRQDDEDPSFDQRAALANARPGAIFLSLHVASTGPVGTARVYFYDFSELAAPYGAPPQGIAPWTEAQRPWTAMSRRLAELLQVELAERFRGSPELPQAAALYQLRLLDEPAVAVEISSAAAENEATLEAMGPQLAAALAQGIASFRPVYEGSVK
jgi:N-acetylmuramoyl-L-alanine amidase